ncbi:acyltransferase family protein [Kineococcus radiotolerans]|uniref:Acyltransferase 3 n=1 Tax=Kineococcus radiotolerans (strain ATCC BAA-149 / DSM 14245 / SRS30216) TaxID=266940 RepID=A6W4T1_KINRD|nr:acyltransferase [Kineococcus radiotolerans]ABS01820.1 acyltransferase 3 [Kineococcus radiotolerans SRS30216 = ATCC BAA-149]
MSRHPTAAPGGPSAGGRLAGLEGYRGIAAVLVVVFHVYQELRVDGEYFLVGTWAHPWLYALDTTVDLFFALSAFLLALPYLRKAVAGERPLGAAEFLRRRAVRIVPLYYLVITAVWATRNGSLPGEWRDLLEHLTFTQVFDDQRIFYTVGPAWSLAVEVQFYVLLAVLGAAVCAVCRRARRRGSRIAVAAASGLLLVAVGVGWKLAAHALGRPETDWSTWFSLPAKLDVFGFGVLLALLVALRGTAPSRLLPPLMVVCSAPLLLAAVWAGTQQGLAAELRHTLAGAGFTLLLGATVLSGPRSVAARALEARPVAFLGLISYSLYLWHEPLMLWMTALPVWPTTSSPATLALGTALLLPVAVLVAWASYWVVEHPAGALRRTRTADGRPRLYYGEGAG